MSKRIAARIASVSLAFMIAFGLVIAPATDKACADTPVPTNTVKYARNITVTNVKGYDNAYALKMGSMLKGAKEVTVKSSKSSVVYVYEYDSDIVKNGILFAANKTGTSTITVKVKKGGKTKTYKTKVKVVKYKSPFKSFKFGSKNITSMFKKENCAYFTNKKTSAKISVKMKPGYTVKKIRYKCNNEITGKDTNKVLKNNKTYKFKADPEAYYETVTVFAYNQKTKVTSEYVVYICE